jgi:hypothetical protein
MVYPRKRQKVVPYAPGEAPVDKVNQKIKEGLLALYNNELLQEAGRDVLGAYDTVIAKPAAKVFTAPGILPFSDASLASLVTPEVSVNFEDIKDIYGTETVPKMERVGVGRGSQFVDTGETQEVPVGGLSNRLARGYQYLKAGADWMFGDARNAGEKMKNGVKWEDLTSAERMGARFLPLDAWLPVSPSGVISKKGIQKFLDEGDYLYATDMKVLREQGKLPGSVGAKVTDNDLLKYDEKPPKDINEVEVKTNKEQLDEYIDKNVKKPTIEQVKDMANKSMEEKGYTDIYGDPKYVQFAETKPKRTEAQTKAQIAGNEAMKKKSIEANTPLANKAVDFLTELQSKSDSTITIPHLTLYNELMKKHPDDFLPKSDSMKKKQIMKLKKIRPEIEEFVAKSGKEVGGIKYSDETFGIIKGGEEATRRSELVEKFRTTFPDEPVSSLDDPENIIGSATSVGVVDLLQNPKFKFYEFLRDTLPTTDLDTLFNTVKVGDPTDLTNPAQKLFNQFKKMEDTRKEVGPLIKPFLERVFPGEGGMKPSVQIAHTFEKRNMKVPKREGVEKKIGYDPEKFIGQGVNPDFLYLDISPLNQGIQTSLEKQANAAGKQGDFNKLSAIQEIMETFGIEGQQAGITIGKKRNLSTKLRSLIRASGGEDNIPEIENLRKAILILEGKGFAKGGIVDAADVQYAAPGGFFAKMFGKPPPYLKEEIAKTDIFSPTIKQKATLTALGPEATAINPGQVFYSNLELSLSKPNSPVKFDSEKEFYDYINAAGIGRDEVSDARIAPYISAKAKSGEPILSEDIIQITSESPLNQLTTEGFGFRSDKINIAKSDIPERYDAPAIERGQPVFKEARYAGTGLMPGFIPGSYRERVLKIDSDKFRGDPGTLPSGASGHNFGDNYTLAWGRATDRPAIINEGEIVDKASGEIINPLAVTDTKKLKEIEAKIQSLVDDPLTKVDPDDFQTISQAVNAIVERSGGRLTYDKAKKAVDAQIVQKQKELRKLQSQFVDEEKRLESIKDVKPQNVTMTFIDEIQSDIAQAATRKARELAIKLDVMAEQGIGVEAMQEGINRDLMQFFADNRSVARPVGATKLELMPQYNELMAFQKQFSDMAKKPPYALAPQDFAMYENFKKRQTEIIDSMADEINDKLMKALYPDVPLKDRGAWSDAVLKQQLYEAAHRLFVEKDPKAPTFLGVASGDIVAGKAYNQAGSTSMDVNERILDKQNRINKYKDNLRQDINTTASLGSSQYPGVGTHEFYGGPKSRAWNEETNQVGGHYTSDIERSMRKYADDNNSKMVVANVAVSDARGGTVYNILNQETGEIMGQGDTYRQAENIANQLVDEDGGRYKIQKSKEKNFDTEPVFAIELTKEMLQLNKIYK